MTGSKLLVVAIAPVLLATPATAMDRYGPLATNGQVRVADPDGALERLAAAASPADHGHGKPPRSARGILRNDRYLRGAFASLDNK